MNEAPPRASVRCRVRRYCHRVLITSATLSCGLGATFLTRGVVRCVGAACWTAGARCCVGAGAILSCGARLSTAGGGTAAFGMRITGPAVPNIGPIRIFTAAVHFCRFVAMLRAVMR